MKKALKWILISFGGLIVALSIALAVFSRFSTHSYWMMGRGLRGMNYGFGGMMPGMGIIMLMRYAFFAAVIALAIYGIIALFRQPRNVAAGAIPATSVAAPVEPVQGQPERVCTKCSKPMQADWSNCPYCGEKLA